MFWVLKRNSFSFLKIPIPDPREHRRQHRGNRGGVSRPARSLQAPQHPRLCRPLPETGPHRRRWPAVVRARGKWPSILGSNLVTHCVTPPPSPRLSVCRSDLICDALGSGDLWKVPPQGVFSAVVQPIRLRYDYTAWGPSRKSPL